MEILKSLIDKPMPTRYAFLRIFLCTINDFFLLDLFFSELQRNTEKEAHLSVLQMRVKIFIINSKYLGSKKIYLKIDKTVSRSCSQSFVVD